MNLLEFFYGRWGRLVPRVSFSSDALGMPWECMGVYIFFEITHWIWFYTAAKNKM